jgi:hypothetical protein
MKLVNSAALKLLVILVIAAAVVLGGCRPLTGPAKSTSAYEVLEPETWVGKELPILDYIDIGEKLKKGNWLVLFYHYDCPDCIEAIQKYKKIFHEIDINNVALGFATIEVPPYGSSIETNCTYGRLADMKEWFVTTPAVVLLTDGQVKQIWQEKLPEIDAVLENIVLTKHLTSSLLKGGDAYGESG